MAWSDWGPDTTTKLLADAGMAIEDIKMQTLDEGNAVDEAGQTFCWIVASKKGDSGTKEG